MRIVILGATGRIGGQAVDAALRSGHSVIAVVRKLDGVEPRERLETLVGDVRDEATLRAALTGAHGVIAALGPRANTREEAQAIETAMRSVVAAMSATGVARLMTLSGAGVNVLNDHKPFIDRLMTRVVRRVARYIVEAKQREYEVVAASDLEWTALRPPLVIGGPARGYQLSPQLRAGARVTRADVGQALVDQVADRSFIRAAPFVLPPARTR